jgi:hypothetical protein
MTPYCCKCIFVYIWLYCLQLCKFPSLSSLIYNNIYNPTTPLFSSFPHRKSIIKRPKLHFYHLPFIIYLISNIGITYAIHQYDHPLSTLYTIPSFICILYLSHNNSFILQSVNITSNITDHSLPAPFP